MAASDYINILSSKPRGPQPSAGAGGTVTGQRSLRSQDPTMKRLTQGAQQNLRASMPGQMQQMVNAQQGMADATRMTTVPINDPLRGAGRAAQFGAGPSAAQAQGFQNTRDTFDATRRALGSGTGSLFDLNNAMAAQGAQGRGGLYEQFMTSHAANATPTREQQPGRVVQDAHRAPMALVGGGRGGPQLIGGGTQQPQNPWDAQGRQQWLQQQQGAGGGAAGSNAIINGRYGDPLLRNAQWSQEQRDQQQIRDIQDNAAPPQQDLWRRTSGDPVDPNPWNTQGRHNPPQQDLTDRLQSPIGAGGMPGGSSTLPRLKNNPVGNGPVSGGPVAGGGGGGGAGSGSVGGGNGGSYQRGQDPMQDYLLDGIDAWKKDNEEHRNTVEDRYNDQKKSVQQDVDFAYGTNASGGNPGNRNYIDESTEKLFGQLFGDKDGGTGDINNRLGSLRDLLYPLITGNKDQLDAAIKNMIGGADGKSGLRGDLNKYAGETLSEADGRFSAEEGDLNSARTRMNDIIGGYKGAEKKLAKEQYDDRMGGIEQNLLDRGFGNSLNLREPMQTQAGREYDRRLDEIDDRLIDRSLGVERDISHELVNSRRDQSGRRFGTVADRSAGQYGLSQGQSQSLMNNLVNQLMGQFNMTEQMGRGDVMGREQLANQGAAGNKYLELLASGEDQRLKALYGAQKDMRTVLEGRTDLPPELALLAQVMGAPGAMGGYTPAGRKSNKAAQNFIDFLGQM